MMLKHVKAIRVALGHEIYPPKHHMDEIITGVEQIYWLEKPFCLEK